MADEIGALDEQQLSILLQAGIDKAGELLVADGGFMPFAACVDPAGGIAFVQIAPEGDDATIGDMYERLGQALVEQARGDALLGSALVSQARFPVGDSETVIRVVVETPGYSRMIVVPFRLVEGALELGEMRPQDVAPVVFATV